MRFLLLSLTLALLSPGVAHGIELGIDRPADGEFVRDNAGLLSPAQVGELRQRCDQLLTDTAVPVFVITLDSIADHSAGTSGGATASEGMGTSGRGMSIETFARTLFDDWGDVHPLMHGQDWKRGILLLVAVRDQRLRVQLGPSWDTDKDAECRRIVDEILVPAFRGGDFGGGILRGVAALDAMARDQPVPQPSIAPGAVASWSALVGLVAVAIGSLFHKGTARVSGRTTRAALTALPAMLYHLTQPRRNATGRMFGTPSVSRGPGGSISGSSGGSFRGVGRGRGASGSW